jgi:MFS family permease
VPLLALSPRARIIATFALHALSQGGLFSRIPDIQQNLQLNEAALGLALLGQPVGAIATFLFASAVLEKVGTRRILMLAIPLLSATVMLIGLAPNALVLGLGFVCYGVLFGLSNIAMNVEADRVEAQSGSRVMNTCHGVWSLGLLGATLIGTLARGAGISPGLHFALMVPLIVAGTALVVWPMSPAPPRAHTGGAVRGRIALPTLMTLILVGFAIAGALLEGALRNWSVIFMRDSFSAPAWVDTLTLPAFLIAQTAGRLQADRLITRFGPVAVARTLLAVALIGLVLVVLSPNLVVALIGFAMVGFGICVSFPLTTSAAARLGDRPASENVAALTLVTQITILGAPALLGYVATAYGIRLTFAILLPFVLVALYLARYLAPRPAIPG